MNAPQNDFPPKTNPDLVLIEQFTIIAAAYDALPTGRTSDPAAEQSYAIFRREMIDQFNMLPVRVERWGREGQPYANSQEMFADIIVHGRLFVFTGGEDHPFITRDENVQFRAVHDYYGHFLGRFQFGPKGEFNAWKAHCQMFGPEAIPALTAETLGQNCWVNFGSFRHLPPQQRPYADQKASLLPQDVWQKLLPDLPAGAALRSWPTHSPDGNVSRRRPGAPRDHSAFGDKRQRPFNPRPKR